jgi:hypothetical protein
MIVSILPLLGMIALLFAAEIDGVILLLGLAILWVVVCN